jgi:predicted RecA/RadA family phage recombinase
MKNCIQPSENITLAAPAAVTSGDGVLVGSLFGVAHGNAVSGTDVVLATVGVFELPKVSADDTALGTKVYWKASTSDVTTTASGNTLIGQAVSAAGNPSNAVRVRLSV